MTINSGDWRHWKNVERGKIKWCVAEDDLLPRRERTGLTKIELSHNLRGQWPPHIYIFVSRCLVNKLFFFFISLTFTFYIFQYQYQNASTYDIQIIIWNRNPAAEFQRHPRLISPQMTIDMAARRPYADMQFRIETVVGPPYPGRSKTLVDFGLCSIWSVLVT